MRARLIQFLWSLAIVREIAASAVLEAAQEYDYFNRGRGGLDGQDGHGAFCAVLYLEEKAKAIRNRGLQPPPLPETVKRHWIKM